MSTHQLRGPRSPGRSTSTPVAKSSHWNQLNLMRLEVAGRSSFTLEDPEPLRLPVVSPQHHRMTHRAVVGRVSKAGRPRRRDHRRTTSGPTSERSLNEPRPRHKREGLRDQLAAKRPSLRTNPRQPCNAQPVRCSIWSTRLTVQPRLPTRQRRRRWGANRPRTTRQSRVVKVGATSGRHSNALGPPLRTPSPAARRTSATSIVLIPLPARDLLLNVEEALVHKLIKT